MTAWAVIDLPEPDSPTTHSVWPGSTESVAPSTASARSAPEGSEMLKVDDVEHGVRGFMGVTVAFMKPLPAVLEVVDLSICLPSGADRALAVEGASLSVLPGQTLCVVGESGPGKSMIANSVMGLLPRPHVARGGRQDPLRGHRPAHADRAADARAARPAPSAWCSRSR